MKADKIELILLKDRSHTTNLSKCGNHITFGKNCVILFETEVRPLTD